jgi:hypothetical protein
VKKVFTIIALCSTSYIAPMNPGKQPATAPMDIPAKTKYSIEELAIMGGIAPGHTTRAQMTPEALEQLRVDSPKITPEAALDARTQIVKSGGKSLSDKEFSDIFGVSPEGLAIITMHHHRKYQK